MQDPAANTAPGRCDDDEVRGEEDGIHCRLGIRVPRLHCSLLPGGHPKLYEPSTDLVATT
jgi:hypothetical protein